MTFSVIGCHETVARDLHRSGAERISDLFVEHGITADIENSKQSKTGWSVRVAWSESTAARNILKRAKHTKRRDSTAFDQIAAGTLAQDHIIREETKARACEQGLRDLDGVVDAHVTLSLPYRTRLLGKVDQSSPKASVIVEVLNLENPPLTQGNVQIWVAGGIEGIEPDAIQVLFVKTAINGRKEPNWQTIGPLRISSESVVPLQRIAVGLGILILSLAVALLWVAHGRKRE